jgi:2,3-bisphosphoglycerate-dependent phosphoglycerate mutase
LFSKFPFKLPATESLKDVVNRVKPFYDTILLSKLKAEKNLLIVAHGNSIRAIIKLLEQLDEEQIRQVEIATATPIIYDIDYDDQGVKINSKIEL